MVYILILLIFQVAYKLSNFTFKKVSEKLKIPFLQNVCKVAL